MAKVMFSSLLVCEVCLFYGLLLAKIFNFGNYVHLTACNLPTFSFWQVCSFDSLFVTCRNLHFAKYVGLVVCYLPKFSFWQVCEFQGMFVC